VHLILDPQGTAELERDLETLAPVGRLILFGNASGRPLDPLPAVGLAGVASSATRTP
jgi:NADPH2:quinone reductase